MADQFPEWWPENPYPADVFPMTREEFVEAIPGPKLRSAIAGHWGRFVFEATSRRILKAMQENMSFGKSQPPPGSTLTRHRL